MSKAVVACVNLEHLGQVVLRDAAAHGNAAIRAQRLKRRLKVVSADVVKVPAAFMSIHIHVCDPISRACRCRQVPQP